MRNNITFRCMLVIMTLMLGSVWNASAAEQPVMANPLEDLITDFGCQPSMDQATVSPSIPFVALAENLDQVCAQGLFTMKRKIDPPHSVRMMNVRTQSRKPFILTAGKRRCRPTGYRYRPRLCCD